MIHDVAYITTEAEKVRGKETKQSHHWSPRRSLLMIERWAESRAFFFVCFTASSSTPDFHQENKRDMNACTETHI